MCARTCDPDAPRTLRLALQNFGTSKQLICSINFTKMHFETFYLATKIRFKDTEKLQLSSSILVIPLAVSTPCDLHGKYWKGSNLGEIRGGAVHLINNGKDQPGAEKTATERI